MAFTSSTTYQCQITESIFPMRTKIFHSIYCPPSHFNSQFCYVQRTWLVFQLHYMLLLMSCMPKFRIWWGNRLEVWKFGSTPFICEYHEYNNLCVLCSRHTYLKAFLFYTCPIHSILTWWLMTDEWGSNPIKLGNFWMPLLYSNILLCEPKFGIGWRRYGYG